jgi:NAD+ kinase
MREIGVVVNPIAGMGGRVGLKGTDGKVAKARERGAEPRAPERARAALAALADTAAGVRLVTAGDGMGATAARDAGFDPEVIEGVPADPSATVAEDTRAAVRAFVDRGVDLILFVGGDGTAVDVAETLDGLGAETPILGVPAGVKVYSEVFGVTPRAAGHIAGTYDRLEDAEVNDIDESAYRDGTVRSELRALARVPVADQRQANKELRSGSVDGIAEGFAEEMHPGTTYVFGPGSTVGAIQAHLGIDGTPLGVDVYRDGEIVARDAGESGILDAMADPTVVVVSPIGGQGFVFGRGNQQISPAVIRESEIEVVASRRKLDGTGVLRVDTGDPALDDDLRGWIRVRTGRHERRLVEVV